MDVQERPGPERGDPQETDRHSDRLAVDDGEQHQRGRMLAQHGDQTAFDVRRQRSAAALRVRRVGIQDIDDAGGIANISEVRPVDMQIHRFTSFAI